MIVCKQCGHQNEDDDLFCGNCPAFLEYSGERIGGPEPVLEEAAAESQPGLVTRIRHAISGTDLPPPTGGAPSAGAPLSPPGSDAPSMRAPTGAPAGGPPAPSRTGDERAAALVAKPDALQPPDARPSVTPRAPEAQRPQTPLPRPKVAKQPPSRKINPGDLVCGGCGEGNDPERNYCRRCGTPLAEATVARTRWFRRRPKRSKKVVAAGDRPGRGGSGRDAARGCASCTRQVPRRALRLQADPGPAGDRRDRGRVRRAEPSQLADRQRVGRLQQGEAHREPRIREHPRRSGADHIVGRGSGRCGGQRRRRQHAHVLVGGCGTRIGIGRIRRAHRCRARARAPRSTGRWGQGRAPRSPATCVVVPPHERRWNDHRGGARRSRTRTASRR